MSFAAPPYKKILCCAILLLVALAFSADLPDRWPRSRVSLTPHRRAVPALARLLATLLRGADAILRIDNNTITDCPAICQQFFMMFFKFDKIAARA
jgi:hypothetical protein